MKKNARYLARAAMIAALYAISTLLLFGFGSSVIQCRISEALCVLPSFIPEAVPALFVGCLLANFLSGTPIYDILFGSLATLLGAIGAFCLRNCKHRFWIPVPTILANTLIIPWIFVLAYGYPASSVPLFTLYIFIGEFISAGILGWLLDKLLLRTHIFH